MNNIKWYIYGIGALIAFIIGCYDAYIRNKKGENIDQFPAMIPIITVMSWLYVLTFFISLYKEKHSNIKISG